MRKTASGENSDTDILLLDADFLTGNDMSVT